VAGEQKPALREIQDFLNFLPSVLLFVGHEVRQIPPAGNLLDNQENAGEE
jgi:hypothetical protein